MSKISQLTPASSLTGAESIPIVQSGNSRKVPVSNILTDNLFTPAGTGAVARSVQSKGRDVVSAKDDGATGDGVTNDRAAVLSVQTDFPTTLIHVPAGTYIFSTAATLSGNFLFYAGAKLKPASGVTITVTGSITAGMYQIFDTAAGGHVDCTSAKIDFAPVEWWGATGGDAAFSSGNAAVNKPLIDEAITYAPYEVHFRQKGIYSTTGHIVDSSHPHLFTGLGKALGAANAVINGVVGSGIAFSDAANMGADLQGSILFVFQNGAAGTNNLPVRFRDIAVGVSNTATVGAVLVGFSTTATFSYLWTADNSAFVGYVPWHWGYCNIAQMNNCDLIGNFAAESESVAPGVASVVHKLSYYSCRMSQTQNASGQIVYQNNAGADNLMFQIGHYGCDFEFGFNGFVLAAQSQIFSGCHMEQIAGTLASGESASRQSLWLLPTAAAGNTIPDLQSKLGPNSVVVTQNQISLGSGATGNISFGRDSTHGVSLQAVGANPNAVVTAGSGSIAVRGGTLIYVNQNNATNWAKMLTMVRFVPAYSANIAIDNTAGSEAEITATNNTAFAIGAPAETVTGDLLSVIIRNTSGGALGAVTWNAIYKLAAWVSPATGFSRSITFRHDGANWVELTRTTVDVPN